MANKAKIGGRDRVFQQQARRLFFIKPEGARFGAYCIDTGRLISLRDTEYDAKKRAGKRGWKLAD